MFKKFQNWRKGDYIQSIKDLYGSSSVSAYRKQTTGAKIFNLIARPFEAILGGLSRHWLEHWKWWIGTSLVVGGFYLKYPEKFPKFEEPLENKLTEPKEMSSPDTLSPTEKPSCEALHE